MKNHKMKNRGIRAIPYIRAVVFFAQANGLKTFTWKELRNAITLYEMKAWILN